MGLVAALKDASAYRARVLIHAPWMLLVPDSVCAMFKQVYAKSPICAVTISIATWDGYARTESALMGAPKQVHALDNRPASMVNAKSPMSVQALQTV
jgi:hypothetical protein